MDGEARPPTVVVLTANSTEYKAIREHLIGVKKLKHASGTLAERGRLRGTRWRVALIETGGGSLTVATLTERVNSWFSPQALFFVGVAGGLEDNIRAGDVVVATKVYSIHGGKQTPEGFFVRPEAWRAAHRLEQAARHALRGTDWVHFKPIAAGDVVLADAASTIADHLRENYNDAVAIEQDGAGVAHAAQLNDQLSALVIRGITAQLADEGTAGYRAAEAAISIVKELGQGRGTFRSRRSSGRRWIRQWPKTMVASVVVVLALGLGAGAHGLVDAVVSHGKGKAVQVEDNGKPGPPRPAGTSSSTSPSSPTVTAPSGKPGSGTPDPSTPPSPPTLTTPSGKPGSGTLASGTAGGTGAGEGRLTLPSFSPAQPERDSTTSPFLTVSPSHGSPADTFTVSGTGCPVAGKQITVYFDGKALVPSDGNMTCKSGNRFTGTFSPPADHNQSLTCLDGNGNVYYWAPSPGSTYVVHVRMPGGEWPTAPSANYRVDRGST
ncbi:hypothetical protein [Streptomyces ehimensis]|uniref:Nucleoside phosphorylase domain-containing protein n=1 Tax=Streptomyces ehimensis TaxID=68195 RepID=A0ABV9BDM0_9ACTN